MLSAKISIISLENSALAISFGKIIEICTEIILNSMREKPIIQVIRQFLYELLAPNIRNLNVDRALAD